MYDTRDRRELTGAEVIEDGATCNTRETAVLQFGRTKTSLALIAANLPRIV